MGPLPGHVDCRHNVRRHWLLSRVVDLSGCLKRSQGYLAGGSDLVCHIGHDALRPEEAMVGEVAATVA